MINPEILILKKFIESRADFNQYFQYINLDEIDLPELVQLFKELNVFYQAQETTTLPAFYLHLKSKVVLNDTHKLIFHQCNTAELPENITDILRNFRVKALSRQLALLSFDVSEGKEPAERLHEFVRQFDETEIKPENEFVCMDLEELYNHATKQIGLRWRLQTLNRSLGSLRQGDFGFVFARPESGKTTFLSSEVSYFAEQAESPILWFNNEEDGRRPAIRVIQATLNLTREELFADIKQHHEEYRKKCSDRIRIHDSANIHRSKVEGLADKLKPSLILFDQIDKIKGFNADREDLRLGNVYIWARELAKEYAPVIGVTQADGSGEGKRWLTMENVANAKTAKQAEADWILGIGKTHDEGLEYVRHLHLSKNKLPGDPDTDPNLRHGKMDCLIDPFRARYKDI